MKASGESLLGVKPGLRGRACFVFDEGSCIISDSLNQHTEAETRPAYDYAANELLIAS